MIEWADWTETDGVALRLVASRTGLQRVEFHPIARTVGESNPSHPLLQESVRQLSFYFAGKLREFDIPLEFEGTEFQRRVWHSLTQIPYGATRSYGELAATIGAPTAVRAVGAANGANPLAIVVPCHRVIGTNGKLVGYGGGLPLKKRLLELERLTLGDDLPLLNQ